MIEPERPRWCDVETGLSERIALRQTDKIMGRLNGLVP
jgi:hypothetical protein